MSPDTLISSHSPDGDTVSETLINFFSSHSPGGSTISLGGRITVPDTGDSLSASAAQWAGPRSLLFEFFRGSRGRRLRDADWLLVEWASTAAVSPANQSHQSLRSLNLNLTTTSARTRSTIAMYATRRVLSTVGNRSSTVGHTRHSPRRAPSPTGAVNIRPPALSLFRGLYRSRRRSVCHAQIFQVQSLGQSSRGKRPYMFIFIHQLVAYIYKTKSIDNTTYIRQYNTVQ